MSTTPTPNEKDREVAHMVIDTWERYQLGDQCGVEKLIASYRAKIEEAQAKETKFFKDELERSNIKCAKLEQRIATLEKALSEAEKLIECPYSNMVDGNCGCCDQCKTLAAIRQAKGQA